MLDDLRERDSPCDHAHAIRSYCLRSSTASTMPDHPYNHTYATLRNLESMHSNCPIQGTVLAEQQRAMLDQQASSKVPQSSTRPLQHLEAARQREDEAEERQRPSKNCARPLSKVMSANACSPPPWSSSNPASAHSDTRGGTCDSAERVAASAVVREGMRVREAARGARGERVAGNGHRAPFEIEQRRQCKMLSCTEMSTISGVRLY